MSPNVSLTACLRNSCYWMVFWFHLWVEQVFVANHTSMIDFIILEQMTAFAVIMQKHPGWVGKFFCQNLHLNYVLIVDKV